tara:strand:- start:6119 stop:6505 length:387 start_codon:yes stop_codon:yes gene_type:complete
METTLPRPTPLQKIGIAKKISNLIPGININTSSIKTSFSDTIKNNNIIGLIVSVLLAFYISDIIYYIIDDVIIPKLSPFIQNIDPAIIKLGSLKLSSRKLFKKLIRFLILSIVLAVIITISKVLNLHN